MTPASWAFLLFCPKQHLMLYLLIQHLSTFLLCSMSVWSAPFTGHCPSQICEGLITNRVYGFLGSWQKLVFSLRYVCFMNLINWGAVKSITSPWTKTEEGWWQFCDNSFNPCNSDQCPQKLSLWHTTLWNTTCWGETFFPGERAQLFNVVLSLMVL